MHAPPHPATQSLPTITICKDRWLDADLDEVIALAANR